MPAQRRAQRQSYIDLPNGKQAHIPSISRPEFRQYKILGIVKAKTLKQLQDAVNDGLKIIMHEMHDGKIYYKFQLNVETSHWDEI